MEFRECLILRNITKFVYCFLQETSIQTQRSVFLNNNSNNDADVSRSEIKLRQTLTD